MAKQTGVKIPAKGDATGGVKIGPTPAPTRTYKNPVLVERDETPGYGQANNLGPSSIEPGTKMTSPLADELKRMNALGDGGDALQDIIEGGVRTHAGTDQTRVIDGSKNVADHPDMARRGPDSGSPGGTVPSKCGAVVTPNPRDPNA